jgi:hypothetical protein
VCSAFCADRDRSMFVDFVLSRAELKKKKKAKKATKDKMLQN